MLHRILTSVLVLGGLLALSVPRANAQSVDLNFSGTLQGNCTFTGTTPGQLGYLSNNTIGTPEGALTGAGFTVSCNAPANLTVSAPVQTAGPVLTPVACSTKLAPSIFDPGGVKPITFNSCSGESPPASVASGTGLVGISVQTANAIPSGTYGYKVTVTLAP